MDLLQRLGGRKFIGFLIVVAVGLIIELKTDQGLSPTMAGFLLSSLTAFAVSNYAVTRQHMNSKGGKGDLDTVIGKIDELSELAKNASDTEAVGQLVQLLQTINSGVADVKSATGQIGTAVVNMGNAIQRRG